MNWGLQELVTIMMLLNSILDMYGKQVRRLYILPFMVLSVSFTQMLCAPSGSHFVSLN